MPIIDRLHLLISPFMRGSLYYLFYWSVSAVLDPFMMVYLSQQGMNGRQLGLLSMFFPLVSFTLSPFISNLADRLGRRIQFLTIALILSAVSVGLMSLPRTFLGFAVVIALMSLFRAPALPLGDSLEARMANRYNISYGGMRRWGSIGFAVTGILFGFIWSRTGYEPMFVVAAILFLPVIFTSRLLEEPTPQPQAARAKLSLVVRQQGLPQLLLAAFLMGASLNMLIIFQGIYMDSLGGGAWMVGLFTGISAMGEYPAMLYGGWLTRRLGMRMALVLGYGLLALSIAGYALAPNAWVLLALSIFRGAGLGLCFVSTVVAIDDRTPPEWSSTIQSVLGAGMWGLAPLIANPIGGFIYDLQGIKAVFWLCAALVTVSAGIIFLRLRK